MLEKQWLSSDCTDSMQRFLKSRRLLAADDSVREITPAGDGNMNVTVRVHLSSLDSQQPRTLIVKQSRPFVAKYDSIAAPLERVEFEAAFYQFVARHPSLGHRMPRLLDWFPQQFALVLEDLGDSQDASFLYQRVPESFDTTVLPKLLSWLRELHVRSAEVFLTQAAFPSKFRNTRLRRLNHAHIFSIPLQDAPVVDLESVCPGLTQASQPIRTSPQIRQRCQELGQRYLSSGPCLLHGDFYPGSWLVRGEAVHVIDPEFCFAGSPEFDLGVLLAHLRFAQVADAEALIQAGYSRDDDVGLELDWALVRAFAAVEVVRRLLGVAQLPLPLDFAQRLQLLDAAACELS